MKQSKMQTLKQNLHKLRRKQQLERRFAQKRKQLSQQLVKKQRQTFVSLLPTLNVQNYSENRHLLSQYARSEQYSYQLIPALGICYEYLTAYPSDPPSWEIITYLSYYEDFQIPQTQQFANKICHYLQQNPNLGSELILNLSRLSKCSFICLQLIDLDILFIIQKILRNSEEQYQNLIRKNNLLQNYQKQLTQSRILSLLLSLSYFFTLKPILQQINLVRICQILNFNKQNVAVLDQFHSQSKFRLILNVIQSNFKQTLFIDFSGQRDIIQIVVKQFQHNITNQFFTYEYQSIKLISRCVKLHIQLPNKLIQNTYMSIKSKQLKSKLLAFKVLQQIFSIQPQVQKMQVQQKKQQKMFNIQTFNQLPTLQDFLTGFRPKENIPVPYKQQVDIKNRLKLYQVMFNEYYSKEYQILLEIVQSSKEEIKIEVLKLIKNLIQSLIKQIQCYSPQKRIQSSFQMFNLKDLEGFLLDTICQQHLYTILKECLQTKSIQLTKLSLQTIQQILCHLFNSKQQQMTNNQNLFLITNLLKQNNIISFLQYQELHNQNDQIKDIVQSILDFINSTQQDI